MVADELFPKALQSLTTWVSVNTNSYRIQYWKELLLIDLDFQ